MLQGLLATRALLHPGAPFAKEPAPQPAGASALSLLLRAATAFYAFGTIALGLMEMGTCAGPCANLRSAALQS